MDRKSGIRSLVLLILVGLNCLIQGSITKRDVESPPTVYLTVSSLASNSIPDRLLELHWEKIHSEDMNIQLYDRDPLSGGMSPLLSIKPNDKGYYRTEIRFPQQKFSNESLNNECLGFWIALAKKDGDIVASNCLRPHPHWQWELRDYIGNLTLIDLIIPGTHNTGSFAAFDAQEDSIFNKYIFTQEEGIWNQMMFGIRYLDLRVAYHRSSNSGEHFWITHSSFRTETTVKDVIEHVKDFLRSTNEIVIMDFHRFVTGFHNRRSESTRRRHLELIALLEQELGEFMIPKRFTTRVTLNHLWQSNRRLYVGYADERARTQSIYMFPAIKHLWADADQVDDLEQYLNETVCNPVRQRLTSAMAHLTPTTAGVLFNAYGGLRKMADKVNSKLTKWFSEDWNHCANIVATDFFLGNNMIELAIETNKKRGVIFKSQFLS